MESLILSVMLKDRGSFDLITSHIAVKEYSREFQIILDHVRSYYDRDPNAKHVDLGLLRELVSGETPNEKHRDRFLNIIDEAYATDTSAQNVEQVVLNAKRNELANQLSIAIVNGKDHEDLLDEYRDMLQYSKLDELLEKGVEVYDASDLDDLLAHEVDPTDRLKVYPLALNERLDGGLRGSDHMIVFARPEMAKTGLVLTMSCGFAKQGKIGIVFNNEERIERLRLRALSCCTGMTAQEIRANPQAARDIAEQMGYHNIIFVSLSPGHPRQIEAFVDKYKAEWFIVDQIRNLAMKSENRTNQLEAAAVAVRNIGKKYDAVAVSVTQAGDSAEGKAVLQMGDVDSSNTGIPGACDVLLGVGATEEQKQQGIRVLSLCKNKVGGIHADFPVRFNQWLSKYISIQER